MRPDSFIRARGLVLAAALVAPLAGCSLLLNFDPEGLPCSSDGECLDGYVCSAQSVCVTKDSAQCSPACGALEECVAGTCKPVCEKGGVVRACEAGYACDTGKCKPAATGALGAPCTEDANCEGTGGTPFGTCVRPYTGIPTNVPKSGGARRGFCSKPCTNDAACGTGMVCTQYGGAGSGTNGICAPKSFVACDQEADCTPSGLTCGLYSVNFPPVVTVRACRAPVDLADSTEIAIGGVCNDALFCGNGLCLPDDGGTTAFCSAPCATDADCTATMPAAMDAKCLDVTMSGFAAADNLKARARMCVAGGGQSIKISCAAGAAACNADAPWCVTGPGTTSPVCAPACAETTISPRCPNSLTCKDVSGVEYCL